MTTKIKLKRFFLKTHLIFALIVLQTTLFAQRDVYLVIGQSNVAGRAKIEHQDTATLSGVKLFNGFAWENARNLDSASTMGNNRGMNRYSSIRNIYKNQGLSFAYTFSKMTHEISNVQIGLIVNARGATNIDHWMPGAIPNYYAQAIGRTNAALNLGGSQLKGILWHQGEANRNDPNYLIKIKELITAFRADFGIPDLPFFVGEISNHRTDNEVFNTHIKKITDQNDPAYIPFTEYATTIGLNTSDRDHFNSNAQRVLGYRYAAKVLNLIYGFDYVQNKIIYVDRDAYVRGGVNSTIAQQQLDPNFIKIKENINANNTMRGLLAFNMSSITAIPYLKIVDASLLMTGNTTLNNGPIDIGFYKTTPDWSEDSVNFTNVPTFSNKLLNSTTTFNSDSNDDDNDGDTLELIHGGADITEFFKDEYTLGTTIISLGLKSEEIGNSQFIFSTKEDTLNYTSRPHIVVSYLVLPPCMPTSGTDLLVSCESYKWIDGITYTSSNNIATYILTNAAGCDSIVNLELTINKINTNTTISGAIITADLAGATYQWINCGNDNESILGESNQSFTPNQNGKYAVIVSNDLCSDTSDCITIETVGLSILDNPIELNAYPNPSIHSFTIKSEFLNTATSLYVVSIEGQQIYNTNTIINSSYALDCSDWPPGIYILTVETEEGNHMLRLVKE